MSLLAPRARHKSWGTSRLTATLLAACLSAGPLHALAQGAAASAPVANSTLDAPLFYQLLIGEIELAGGQANTAYEVVLDAARRTRDDALFRRAVDIALGARSGDRALAAAKAWRIARPESLEPLRLQLQMLVALNRLPDATEVARSLLAQTPAPERSATLASLPRLAQRSADRKLAQAFVEQAVAPYLNAPATRNAARVALGRAALAAGDTAKALEAAQRAQADDPETPGAALLALDMAREKPQAESLVQAYLKQPAASTEVRLGYVRMLTAAQRFTPAIEQLSLVTQAEPNMAAPWLTLGALQLELRNLVPAQAALRRYVELAQAQGAPRAVAGEDDDDEATTPAQGLTQAWLMLSQAAEQGGDYAQAEQWLARIDNPQRALDVLARRAGILARQGQLAKAQELLRGAPERTPDDARAKLLAQAQLLRDARQWRPALELLQSGGERFPEDMDLVYEQAMMAEKLGELDLMERKLRQVIQARPEHAHAHNALGYSLAERKLRLPEARQLIARALQLSPGDPYITDSLGWVEYRMGNAGEALRLLRAAYSARPDTEIAAHLGEVLWASGQREEALRVWRDARGRDAANDVLRETLARLKVDL